MIEFLRETIAPGSFPVLFAVIIVCGTSFPLFAFLFVGKNPGDAMWHRSHAFREHGVVSGYTKLIIFNIGEETLCRGGLEIAQWYLSDGHVIVAAVVISGISGFLMPPHNEFPIKMRFAVWLGGFALSLIFLKSGGWDGTGKLPVMPLLFVIVAHVCATTVMAVAFAWHYRDRLGLTDRLERLGFPV